MLEPPPDWDFVGQQQAVVVVAVIVIEAAFQELVVAVVGAASAEKGLLVAAAEKGFRVAGAGAATNFGWVAVGDDSLASAEGAALDRVVVAAAGYATNVDGDGGDGGGIVDI